MMLRKISFLVLFLSACNQSSMPAEDKDKAPDPGPVACPELYGVSHAKLKIEKKNAPQTLYSLGLYLNENAEDHKSCSINFNLPCKGEIKQGCVNQILCSNEGGTLTLSIEQQESRPESPIVKTLRAKLIAGENILGENVFTAKPNYLYGEECGDYGYFLDEIWSL